MTMKEAADASMLSAPEIPETFKIYAYVFAIDQYNRSKTAACKGGKDGISGQPPLREMGIDTRLEIMVPFGNTCTYYEKPKRKGQVVHRRGRIIGYGVDSTGYVAVLEESNGQIRSDSEDVCITNITPDRANKV